MTDWLSTNDVVAGDYVRFERDVYDGGSFYRGRASGATYAGREAVEGRVIAESYGAQRGQHTFTIERADGSKLRIKGRNLYRHGVERRAWPDEAARQLLADSKHARAMSGS